MQSTHPDKTVTYQSPGRSSRSRSTMKRKAMDEVGSVDCEHVMQPLPLGQGDGNRNASPSKKILEPFVEGVPPTKVAVYAEKENFQYVQCQPEPQPTAIKVQYGGGMVGKENRPILPQPNPAAIGISQPTEINQGGITASPMTSTQSTVTHCEVFMHSGKEPRQTLSMNPEFDRLRKFPDKLWEVVNSGTKILSWTVDGLSFEVNEDIFGRSILNVHPGLVQIPSFVNFRRQLREYGFEWGKTNKTTYVFKHPYFQRDKPELLTQVRTKRHVRHAGDCQTRCQRKIRSVSKSSMCVSSQDDHEVHVRGVGFTKDELLKAFDAEASTGSEICLKGITFSKDELLKDLLTSRNVPAMHTMPMMPTESGDARMFNGCMPLQGMHYQVSDMNSNNSNNRGTGMATGQEGFDYEQVQYMNAYYNAYYNHRYPSAPGYQPGQLPMHPQMPMQFQGKNFPAQIPVPVPEVPQMQMSVATTLSATTPAVTTESVTTVNITDGQQHVTAVSGTDTTEYSNNGALIEIVNKPLETSTVAEVVGNGSLTKVEAGTMTTLTGDAGTVDTAVCVTKVEDARDNEMIKPTNN